MESIEKYQPVSIGTIELSNIGEEFIAEMSPRSVPLSYKIGFCKIEVWPNEGPIPHFHIISKNDINWECCIEIYNSKYFHHGSKQGTLTNKQLSILDSWLREKSKIHNYPNLTNWDLLCIFWLGQGNPTKLVTQNPVQPDYTKTV